MIEKKDTIILSGPTYRAEDFKRHIIEAIRLIPEILRLSTGCEMDASEVASRTYVLDWLAYEVEIKDEQK